MLGVRGLAGRALALLYNFFAWVNFLGLQIK